MINSRNLDDLRPEAKALAEKFIRQCAAVGIDVLITSTLRDNECQAELYAQGRSKPGNRVTNAMPGQSFHNYGVAFDFVPMTNGKPNWNDLKLLNRCGVIAEACGLDWAGRWQTFRELLHCQMPGLTIAQLKAEAAAG
jgi:peptidoglycan L-alanyl-D-glutamate endopeptidase CwlK